MTERERLDEEVLMGIKDVLRNIQIKGKTLKVMAFTIGLASFVFSLSSLLFFDRLDQKSPNTQQIKIKRLDSARVFKEQRSKKKDKLPPHAKKTRAQHPNPKDSPLLKEEQIATTKAEAVSEIREVSVSGQVKDLEGQPIENAEIEIGFHWLGLFFLVGPRVKTDFFGRFSMIKLRPELHWLGSKHTLLRELQPYKKDGRIRLSTGEQWTLTCRKPGFIDVKSTQVLRNESLEFDITLKRGRTLYLHFQSSLNERINIEEPVKIQLLSPASFEESVTSVGKDGQHTFSSSKHDLSNSQIIIKAKDYQSVVLPPASEMRKENRQIHAHVILQPGLILTGCVRDSTGQPIDKAKVCLYGLHSEFGLYESKTDEDGFYRFCGLEKGKYLLVARSRTEQSEIKPLRIDSQSPVPQDLDLETGRQLQLKCIDEKGRVIRGVRVAATIFQRVVDHNLDAMESPFPDLIEKSNEHGELLFKGLSTSISSFTLEFFDGWAQVNVDTRELSTKRGCWVVTLKRNPYASLGIGSYGSSRLTVHYPND